MTPAPDPPVATAAARRAPRRSARVARIKEAGLGYLLILPALAVFCAFTFYPFYENFVAAAHKQGPYPGSPSKFVGPSQFTSVVTSSEFYSSLRATAIFVAIAVPVGVILGLALAVFANQKLRGIAFFQTVFASTTVTSVAVASVIFYVILSPSNGLMQYFGIDTSPGIAQSPSWAIEAVAGIQAWQFMGFAFIVMLAGLQSLNEEVVEAARMDGAGSWRVFWRVIFPLMSPTIFFATVVGIILALQSFGAIDILIGQGQVPYTKTNVLVNYIYNEILQLNAGTAACLSIALFGITFVVTFIQFRVLERRVHYG